MKRVLTSSYGIKGLQRWITVAKESDQFVAWLVFVPVFADSSFFSHNLWVS